MKLLTLLLFISTAAQGQKIEFKYIYYIPDTHTFKLAVEITDTIRTVAYAQCDTCQLVVIDSAATIRVLYEVEKQNTRLNNIRWAAQDILTYITVYGDVIDYKKFRQTVKAYQLLLKQHK